MVSGAPQTPAHAPLDPGQAEAYRQGWEASHTAAQAAQKPAPDPVRRRFLAAATLTFGIGSAVGLVAYQQGYAKEVTTIAVIGAVGLAVLGAVEMLLDPDLPTPRYGFSGVALGRN